MSNYKHDHDIILDKLRLRSEPSFDNFLVGHGKAAYIYYRLRYFFFNSILAFGALLVEFFLIKHSFAASSLIFILLLKITSILVMNFWTGYLEYYRIRFKSLYEKDLNEEIKELWKILAERSINIGVLIAIVTVAISYFLVKLDQNNFMALILIVAYIPLQLFLRSAHILVYAKKRIFLPITYCTIFNFFFFLFIYSVKDYTGQASFYLAIMGSNMFGAYLFYKYISLHFRRMQIPKYRVIRNLLSIQTLRFRFNFKVKIQTATISKILTGLRQHALIIYVIIHFLGYPDVTHIFVLYYFLTPLLNMAAKWPQMFYFDMVSKKIDAYVNVRKNFIQFLSFQAVIIGGLFALVCIAVGAFFLENEVVSDYVKNLIFLFAINSVYATLITNNFSIRDYTSNIFYESFILVGIIIYSLLYNDVENIITLYSSLLAVCTAAMLFFPRKRKEGFINSHSRVHNLAEWISRSTNLTLGNKVSITHINFSKKYGRKSIKNFIQKLNSFDKENCTFFSNSTSAHITSAIDNTIMRNFIITAAAGTCSIKNIEDVINQNDISLYAQKHDLQKHSKVIIDQARYDEIFNDLKFKKKYVITPSILNEDLWKKIGSLDYKKILASFEQIASPLTRLNIRGYKIYASYSNGQINEVIVLENEPNQP